MSEVVGREHELAALEVFLAAARQRFSVLSLEGEAGIGKTTVWREAVRRAESDGFRVLSTRPAQAEAKLALSAVGDLLDGAPPAVFESLPDPQRRAIEIALLRTDPGQEAIDERIVATAVRAAIVGLSTSQPLLIAVDDVQWLDTASASVLGYVLRRVANEHIGLVVTRRLGEPLRLRVEELAPPEALARATIGPLSVAATHHLLKQHLGEAPSRSTLIRIHEASAGNPLFALEIGRLVADIGPLAAGDPLPVPSDVEALLRKRVARLPRRTRELLVAAAALGNPREELLRAAHGGPIGADLEPAETRGIAALANGVVRFGHPLFGAALYSAAADEERRRLHRRLAAIVTDPEERARHLALAVEGRDEATAAAVHAAARETALRGAPEAAAELVELSLSLGEPHLGTEAARIYDLADYLALVGDNKRARALLESVDPWHGWPAHMHGYALELWLELEYWINGPSERLEQLGARLLSGELPDAARAQVHASLAQYCEHDLQRAAGHAEAALELLESLGRDADPLVHATALTFRTRNRLVLGDGLDRDDLNRVLELEARVPPGRGRLILPSDHFGQWLKYVDDLDEARTLLADGLERDLAAGYEKGALNKLQHLALTECAAGNLELAREHACRACELVAQERSNARGYALAIRAIVDAHLGDADAVRAAAEQYRLDGNEDVIHVQVAVGLLELSLGDDRAASVHLGRALDLAERAGHREPGIHRVHANAAEAMVGLGELDRAAAIAAYLEEHGARTSHRWSLATGARCRALVAAARGDVDAALAAAEAALAAHEGLPIPFERARTLLVKGVIERRARRRGQAKESLQEAAQAFEDMGARLWAERARGELDRVGLRRSSGDELTGSERRIAELAASGLTNREVAAALFVSPKTVEANLGRVYRKLGIGSRAELGARMGERLQT